MADEKDLTQVFSGLDQLLSNSDISHISADTNPIFSDLPAGYFLCEVTSAELRESKSHAGVPQAAFRFKVVEDGIDINDKGKLVAINKTKGKSLGKYYTFKDDRTLRQFVSDMLKFEGEVPGEPILPKEAFLRADTIADAIDVLVGARVYIHNDVRENDDGTTSAWQNLLSWKMAKSMGLPE